ncbi:hypothetical protein C8F04DRAFT_1269429 [Mycena alexandri]|uniref:Uncharacterized protein n=1 Tax=Mycena alexandri TaxID=1745969 RepID=A0AAD6SEK8_9AGAR|nr:hypothetical protein C8F04DRAFT_1269429 [Mycena alexandri]
MDTTETTFPGFQTQADAHSQGRSTVLAEIMSRRTRSGAQFSPYELLQLPDALRHFQVIRTKISLDALLHDAIADDDRYAAEQDAANSSPEDAWEDEDEDNVASDSALPLHHRHSRLFLLPPPPPCLPLKPPVLLPLKPPTLSPPPVPIFPSTSPAPGYNSPSAELEGASSHREQEAHTIHFDLAAAPVAAGAWVGRQRANAKRRLCTLPELLDEGSEVLEWNGRDPKLILDAEGRIIAILLGTPEDEEWAAVIEDAVIAMARAGANGGLVPFTGAAPTFLCGRVSHSAAKPGNLCHTPFIQRLIRRLLRNKSIRRIAGFQSMGLALYAPKLYRYYCKVLRALFRKHPNLTHTFRNSIFPAVTLNCGDTVPSSTATSSISSTASAPLPLAAASTIGATILIPSGCLDHGNTPIQTGETRYSMTQYAAGGLFRWAAYGFQSVKSLLAQPGGEDVKNAFDGVPGSRWKWGLDLFSNAATDGNYTRWRSAPAPSAACPDPPTMGPPSPSWNAAWGALFDDIQQELDREKLGGQLDRDKLAGDVSMDSGNVDGIEDGPERNVIYLEGSEEQVAARANFEALLQEPLWSAQEYQANWDVAPWPANVDPAKRKAMIAARIRKMNGVLDEGE